MVLTIIALILALSFGALGVYLFLKYKEVCKKIDRNKIDLRSLETVVYRIKDEINDPDTTLDGVAYNYNTRTATIVGNLKVTGSISAGNSNVQQ